MLALTYIAQSVHPLGYGLDDGRIKVRFQSVVRDTFLYRSVHAGFSAHSVSYLTDTGGSFPWVKAVGA
jgi:hypothetical protein